MDDHIGIQPRNIQSLECLEFDLGEIELAMEGRLTSRSLCIFSILILKMSDSLKNSPRQNGLPQDECIFAKRAVFILGIVYSGAIKLS